MMHGASLCTTPGRDTAHGGLTEPMHTGKRRILGTLDAGAGRRPGDGIEFSSREAGAARGSAAGTLAALSQMRLVVC